MKDDLTVTCYLIRKGKAVAYWVIAVVLTALCAILAIIAAINPFGMLERTSLVPTGLLLMLMVIIIPWFYCDVAPYFLTRLFMEDAEGLYLCGRPLGQYYDTELFSRLSVYLGYGLCYEATTLAMMTMKRHRTARIIIGKAVDRQDILHIHAWVEFRAFGRWWVMDPTWGPTILSSKRQHDKKIGFPKVCRIISYAEFWDFGMVQDYYAHIQNQETSQVFNELLVFHNSESPDYKMMFEKIGRSSLDQNGKQANLFWIEAFGQNKPITPRMITRMLDHPRSLEPNHHLYRISMCIAKTVKKSLARVVEYEKRTGITATICYTGFRSYDLCVNDTIVESVTL